MRVVVALGGNALLRRGEEPTAEAQRRNLEHAVTSVAAVARDHELVLTHGNGPQVGMLAVQRTAGSDDSPYPLDVLVAETEGMIGYLISQKLRRELPNRDIATLLTQVQVDPDDPAFENPTKPVGQVYTEEEARAMAERRGWTVARDGEHWRRVVPSPRPKRILDLGSLRVLAEHNAVVVCGGGGGIPVLLDEEGGVEGVEGVVDKDRTAALLARQLAADALILLTDVDGVYRDWGGPRQELVREMDTREARTLELPAGSMAPKVEACAGFVEATGHIAGIGALEDALDVLEGRAGTRIVPAEAGEE